MKRLLLLLFALLFHQTGFGQTNYLVTGNQYLAEKKYSAAERTFKEAIKSDSSNLIYKCQLALSLMQQKKYVDAQNIINAVLVKDPLNIGALWYGGVNGFSNEQADVRTTISYFEKVLPLLKENQGQFYSANWFIGRSYQNLLQTTGLNYGEVSRMIECYTVYLQLQPDAENAAEITKFIRHIKGIRPSDKVKNWINSI